MSTERKNEETLAMPLPYRVRKFRNLLKPLVMKAEWHDMCAPLRA
jgi:hypothetical protein